MSCRELFSTCLASKYTTLSLYLEFPHKKLTILHVGGGNVSYVRECFDIGVSDLLENPNDCQCFIRSVGSDQKSLILKTLNMKDITYGDPSVLWLKATKPSFRTGHVAPLQQCSRLPSLKFGELNT